MSTPIECESVSSHRLMETVDWIHLADVTVLIIDVYVTVTVLYQINTPLSAVDSN